MVRISALAQIRIDSMMTARCIVHSDSGNRRATDMVTDGKGSAQREHQFQGESHRA